MGEEEKKEDEKDKDDEEKKDDDEDEEEEREEEEEEEEKEKEEEDTKSPRALELEKKISLKQTHLDYYNKKLRLFPIHIRLANTCLETMPDSKCCQRKKDYFEKKMEK